MLLHTFTVLAISTFVTDVFSATTNYKVIPDDDSDPYKPLPEAHIDEKETEIKYWREKGNRALHEKLQKKLNTNVAKNVIFFMGDGMSIPTITASRIYQGQLNKQNGEENQLFFETFPYSGLSKTYCVDKQVPDSASTSTAYLRGVKANYMTIGVTAKVKPADCESAKIESNRPTSILKWAQDAGKATGIVTTTRITDASPAGAYAHVPLRDMECDADVVELGLDVNSCDYDIAKQMIHEKVGRNLKVIMGGGREKFLPQGGVTNHGFGSRLDKDLIEDWKTDKRSRNATGAYIISASELAKIDVQKTDYLLGLFARGDMSYNLERPDDQPTLSQMTETAIKILQKDPKGFFLFVEGGLIDKAHHLDRARKALVETIEFSKAIEAASKLTKEEDTLIVVTADHAHTMTINGYPARGHDILGIYGKSKNGRPYSTLSYANGLGYRPESAPGDGFDMEHDDLHEINYKYPALVLKDYESHGGDDVAVFAKGPWAHLFSGNFEQSFIPIAEAYAANITVPDETRIQHDTTPAPGIVSSQPVDQTTDVSSTPEPTVEPKNSSKIYTSGYCIPILSLIVIFLRNISSI